jgi:hypothetical protein
MNQATNIGTVEAALRRSEREKDLEKQVDPPCLDLPPSLSVCLCLLLTLVLSAGEGKERQRQIIEIIDSNHWQGKLSKRERGGGEEARLS